MSLPDGLRVQRRIGGTRMMRRSVGPHKKGYEYGHVALGKFVFGDKLKRPYGKRRSKVRVHVHNISLKQELIDAWRPKAMIAPKSDVLSQVNRVVAVEVKSRLARARDAAIKAFDAVLAGE